MKSKVIFGFGSLISTESLRVTAPNAFAKKPAYIKGFRRDFSLWDPVGYTETNLDLVGIPFCALDIQKVQGSEFRVNGVVFTVSGKDFEQLLIRESEYSLIETDAYDYRTDEVIGICEVFSSGKNNASFDFDSAPSKRYLSNYLQAARLYGDKYYQEILNTTFIGSQRLSEITELTKLNPT